MSNSSSTLTYPERLASGSYPASDLSISSSDRQRLIEKLHSLYQADHQAKFLNLQAEVDCLLQQLETIKNQKVAGNSEPTAPIAEPANV